MAEISSCVNHLLMISTGSLISKARINHYHGAGAKMNKRCKKCGSYAFNLHWDDIEQIDLCDRHYWQYRAENPPRSLIAQSIYDYVWRNGKTCEAAYAIICAMQENWGEWEDSFFGDKAEQMQGRVFCLIVAESLS
jgi:hypothetical protein